MNAMQNCQNFDFWFQCNNMDQESTQQYNVVNCLSKMSSEEVVKKEVGKDMSNKDFYKEVNKEVSEDVEMDGSNPDAPWKNWEEMFARLDQQDGVHDGRICRSKQISIYIKTQIGIF